MPFEYLPLVAQGGGKNTCALAKILDLGENPGQSLAFGGQPTAVEIRQPFGPLGCLLDPADYLPDAGANSIANFSTTQVTVQA